MPVAPNKPTFFAIDHDDAEVATHLEKFKTALKGKKVLYIELDKSQLFPVFDTFKHASGHKHTFTNFELLAHTALQNGIIIKPLDSEKTITDMHEHKKRMRQDYLEVSPGETPPSAIRARYLNLERREKEWEPLLRNQPATTLVVMHPGHARAMIKRLGLKKENIAFFGKTKKEAWGWELKARADARRELQRVTQERIKRRIARKKIRPKHLHS